MSVAIRHVSQIQNKFMANKEYSFINIIIVIIVVIDEKSKDIR